MRLKTLEECIAYAMDCEDTEILPFLPYILQDFFEIGSSAESISKILKKYTRDYHKLKVLDLGCGKGAATLRIAEKLKCSCSGIDGIPEFIQHARSIAKERKLDRCNFTCADIRDEIKRIGQFDVIILGSIGPLFGNYFETMKILKNNLTTCGLIILDDGYVADSKAFKHEYVVSRKELLNQIEQAGMKVVDEFLGEEISNTKEYKQQQENIIKRCGELEKSHPDKEKLFKKFIQKQKMEYDNLEQEIICSTMVIRRKKTA